MSQPHAGRTMGLMAEFATPGDLIEAAKRVKAEGYANYDAFSPYPIEELSEVVAGHDNRLSYIVFGGGLVGAIAGFTLQYWSSVIAYPLNVGGRPLNSWPAFIVPTFETTILFAGFAAVLGMFALNGLPRPHHPVFSVERFALASRDSYFLYVEAKDPKYDAKGTRTLLQGLNPTEIMDVYDD